MQAINIYGCFYIQFPKFTYLRVGGFSGEPIRLPRYCLDNIILYEICRQFVCMIESLESTKKSSSSIFPIEIGHYRCSNFKQVVLTKTTLSRLYLKPYSPREDFDYIGLSRDNFKHASSLFHVPHLENYWANCPDEFEVRKRLWSRLRVSQINMFKVNLSTHGMMEDEVEEVIDLFYVDQIECIPISEIDWTRREEDDLLSCTS